MRLSCFLAAALASVSGYALTAASPAQAASPTDVGEVVVTSTPLDGTGVPLSRVPANAQTLGATAIVQQSDNNLADALNNSLGSVSVSDGTGNPYQKDVNYRGFQVTSLLGAPVSMAVYFDGVRVNEPFGSIVNWDLIPTNAVSRVDVLPGSKPVFGLNALGGSLVVNTKNGKDNPGLALSLLGGSFGRWAGSIEAGGSDAASHTDYFLAVNDDREHGFRNYSASRVAQLYGNVRWHGPDDKTLVELSGAYANTKLNGTQSLPMDMLGNPKSAYTWPDAIDNQMGLITLKASHWLDAANQLSGQVYYRQSNSQGFNSNADLDDGCFTATGAVATTTTGGVTTFKCGNQAPNGTAVNSITGAAAQALGYGRWTSSINASMVDSTTHQNTLGASGQWGSTNALAGHKNSFILGGAFDHTNVSYRQDSYLARLINYQTVIIPNQEYGFTANGLAPSPTNLPAFTGNNDLGSVMLSSKVDELNVYLTDTFDVTDKFSITASGSYEYTSIKQVGVNNQYLNDDGGYSWTDDVTGVAYYNPSYASAYKFSNTTATGAVATVNGAPAGSTPGPEASSLNGTHNYQRFNPAIGFNYNLDPAFGLFGGYSQSMRAPTSVELSCANPLSPCALPTGFNGDPNLKAVTAGTVEFGGRGRLNGLISWNAAVYDSRLQNDIQFIATSTTYGYFYNVGATDRRGFEVGAQAQLDRLSLSANYGYVEATYRSPFTTAAGETVRSGNYIPGIPKNTFKLRADYKVTKDFHLGGTMVATDAQYAHGNENNADPTGKVPGYVVFNLDAQYLVGPNLKFALNVDNLLDQKYATYGLSGSNSIYTLAAEQFRTPAAPRGVWLRVTYAFGGVGGGVSDDRF